MRAKIRQLTFMFILHCLYVRSAATSSADLCRSSPAFHGPCAMTACTISHTSPHLPVSRKPHSSCRKVGLVIDPTSHPAQNNICGQRSSQQGRTSRHGTQRTFKHLRTSYDGYCRSRQSAAAASHDDSASSTPEQPNSSSSSILPPSPPPQQPLSTPDALKPSESTKAQSTLPSALTPALPAAAPPAIQAPKQSATAAAAASIPAAALSPAVHAVLFNAPNCVCWLRLLLMLAGVHQAAVSQHMTAFCLFLVSMGLDAVDGWLARKLGQTTSFGALLDVVLDILLRGWLWVNALPASVALLLPLLEMMVFAVTHKVSGAEWKVSFFAAAPPWVSAVMSGGRFSSPAGWLAVAGLMGAPLWAWCVRHLPSHSLLTSPAWGLVLVPGRVLAAAVELWVVWHYLKLLLHHDIATASGTTAVAAATGSAGDATATS